MDYLRWFPSALAPLPPAVANFHMPIESVRSMADQEPLEFVQDADCGHFAVNCTGFLTASISLSASPRCGRVDSAKLRVQNGAGY